MMRTMRENTKVILWIVVVAFVVTIFAVWGLDLQTGDATRDPGVLGKVNGVPITRTLYQSFYETLAGQFRAASNEPLTYSQEQFIANQAWDNLIYTLLTDQEIRKLGIIVTDDEIVGYLRTSPPQEIRPYFLDEEGNFDNQAYQAALNNPEIDWTNLERLARERIPRLKFQNYMSAEVHVNEDEIRQAYLAETIEMTVAYVEFPIDDADVADYSPSEEEIEEYYNSHQDEFVDPAKARLDIVRFDFKPSAADLSDAAFTARRIQEQILSGEDFGVLAKTYSEAPTSHVDGTTGFLKRGQREDGYFDALDGMNPGDVSEPVAGDAGYYVLKLIEKKTENEASEYNAQEILIKTTLSRPTVDSLYNLSSELKERATDAGIEVAASETGQEILTPEPFSEEAPIGALGFVPVLNRFAFSNEVGTVSPVLRDEDHLYVARVVDRIPEGVRPISDVSESIRYRLLFDARTEITRRNAQAFYRKTVSTSFEEAVAAYEVTAVEPAPFKAVDNFEGFGPNSAVANAALNLEVGQVCPPIESRRSFIVLRVTDKSDLDDVDYRARSPRLKDAIESQKIQAYVAYWFEKLKAESVIEDYRDRAY